MGSGERGALHVFVALPPGFLSSRELASGLERLRATLPATASWHVTLEGDLVGFLGRQVEWIDTLSGHALLLFSPAVLISPAGLPRLTAALAAGAGFADALDSRRYDPLPAPSYATLRGFEAYSETGRDLPSIPAASAPPLLRLISCSELARRLRTGTLFDPAGGVRVPGAFAHYFGGYYAGAQPEIALLVPASARRVLDVGGGEGGFGAALKAGRGCEVDLVELNPWAARVAAGRVDRIFVGSFLELDLPVGYDGITLLDALEHTADPAAVLRRARSLLSQAGVLVVTVPNVGHWTVVADLIAGRWDYVPDGIHCATHVRFFTERTLNDLVTSCGFVVERLERVRMPAPAPFHAACSALAPSGVTSDPRSLDTYAFQLVARPDFRLD